MKSVFRRAMQLALVVAVCGACTRKPEATYGLSKIDCGDGLGGSADAVLSNPARFIAHAGGAIQGYTYTDSADALHLAIANGFRLIEIDFIRTSDGHLVAAHDWKHWRKITGSARQQPTLEQFLRTPILGRFSPMSFEQVADIFAKNPRLVLVTDKTDDFEYLASSFPDPDRLLVEVFKKEDLARGRQAGLRHLMPSTLWGRDDMATLIQKHGVRFLAISTRQLATHAEAVKDFLDRGVCTYAFSTNQTTFVEAHLTKDLFGVYTDYYVPKHRAFSCGRQCKTY